jgi:hypothetical protein
MQIDSARAREIKPPKLRLLRASAPKSVNNSSVGAAT